MYLAQWVLHDDIAFLSQPVVGIEVLVLINLMDSSELLLWDQGNIYSILVWMKKLLPWGNNYIKMVYVKVMIKLF